jgi:hypothetical protein
MLCTSTHTHTLSDLARFDTAWHWWGRRERERVAGRKGVCWLLASCVLLTVVYTISPTLIMEWQARPLSHLSMHLCMPLMYTQSTLQAYWPSIPQRFSVDITITAKGWSNHWVERGILGVCMRMRGSDFPLLWWAVLINARQHPSFLSQYVGMGIVI